MIVVIHPAVVFAGVLGHRASASSRATSGGWVDQVIMRITDTWLALPGADVSPFSLAAIVGAERVEHRDHPGRGLLDALRPRHPRRGALDQGA